eukprot:scaffold10369_cov211-Skeletonema_marinoi.AAC.4
MSRNYGALARDCNLSSSEFVKNITSSEGNEDIIWGLRCGRVDELSIGEEDDKSDCLNFTVREGDDLGWLGYYIGNSTALETLHINDMPGDVDQIDDFLGGLNRNRSIQELWIHNDDLGDDISEKLIGDESARKLGLALRDTSLKSLELAENLLSKEGFAEIVNAASTQSQIENLLVSSNDVGRVGCRTLGTLLGSGALNILKNLYLEFNGIDDSSLQTLASGLTNNTTLEVLSLCGNRSITGDGLRSLIPFLHSESCSLRDFYCYHNNCIDDVGAVALADGLAKNNSLTRLWFDPTDCGIEEGWQSFLTLLCDTSSINNTYLSNHTLELIGESCNYGSPTNQVHDRVRDLIRMRSHATR